jgi:membrane dipeptidase
LFVPRDASPGGPRIADLERSYARVSEALSHTPPFAPAAGCVAPSGSVRAFFAFEGSGPLAAEPEKLALWASRGLRIVGLVHTYANELASSSGDAPPKDFGLTELGRAFARRAFALGLVVDVSHASDLAVNDVLAIAKETRGVVVATHSNSRVLADHPRNLTDAQLRGIAATGGVVGVNFHAPFVVRGRKAKLADVVAQVEHLRDVAGIDHVAIGSDFEGDIRPPAELRDASRFPRLSAALSRAGFDDAAIAAIFAGNALRVLCPPAK